VALQVGVAQHGIVEAIAKEDVRYQRACCSSTNYRRASLAEHEHRLVAQLIIFDYGQSRERLSQTNTIRQNAAVVGLQLVDDAGGCVPLEVIELFSRSGCLGSP